jgi:4-aminobutyrate aminotransferase/(S)-3-amino-2-methylpropionate transaminase
VWSEARGANVVDVDGNVYVDLASGFGVASMGHAHPRITHAIETQARHLVHGFGDVHPSTPKIELLERLAAMAPFPDARVILGAHGADAIEAALKTAMLHTGRAGVMAFVGSYHGLSHGPLSICGYREDFRAPFLEQLSPHTVFAPWPSEDASVDQAIAAVREVWDMSPTPIGALFVEPILGRGGVRLPPRGFLRALGALARERNACVVADEILVGLGRCGTRFVSVEDELTPDLLCVGKSLGGGMPISACIGKNPIMASWGDSAGEAIHTATFFGHPLACAAALASLDVIEEENLAALAREKGAFWLETLSKLKASHPSIRDVRGRGMLMGIELDSGVRTLKLIPALLTRGWITLAAGMGAEVLQIVPPITIDDSLLFAFVRDLEIVLSEVGA